MSDPARSRIGTGGEHASSRIGTAITADRRPDLVGGLVAAGVGAAVLLHVRGFPELPDGQPGPALFPGIVGALLVVFGLVLAGRALWGRGATDDPRPTSATRGRIDALAVLGAIVAYLLLAETLGFALTMALLLFLLTWRLGARPWAAAVSAVVTTASIVLVFEYVLFVPLPQGLAG